ncbi:MAG: sulfite exporter TauE/SafE family protein [Oscillospiraceae bacterium]|nr:sulfite exporter TauE/SafE family protein [Oscillospiraceae bacterium]
MKEFFIPFLLSVGTGILSGWGVGGGTLLLICMTLLLGVEQRQAQAINLIVFLPTAALSLFFHRKNGLLNKNVWIQAAVPGMGAAVLCSLMALKLDVSILRKPFGIFLLYSGCTMLYSIRRKNANR